MNIPKENNFNFLRLLAASLVLFSHSYSLLFAEIINEPLAKYTEIESFGVLAVYIFFVISGYLITGSFIRNPNIKNFIINRILRIIPALAVVVIISAFIMGALVTNLSLLEYFLLPQTYLYIVRNIFLFPVSYILPGVFEDNIYPNAVNGSLWTLRLEFTLYIMVAILGVLKILNNKIFLTLIALSSIICIFFINNYSLAISNIVGVNLLQVIALLLKNGAFFIMGMIFFVMGDKIKTSNRSALSCLIFIIFFISTEFIYYILLLTLPYLVLYLSAIPSKFMKLFNKYGDFSYGIYIYAFPIQQLYIHLLYGSLNITIFFLLSFFTALICAILSWNFIEKPALKFKKYE